jgi:arylsulfate sulfotransferase
MTRWIAAAVVTSAWLWVSPALAARPSVTLEAQSAGPTPFIRFLELDVSDVDALRRIEFVVASRPGSSVRPIRARYSLAYLEARGYVDREAGRVTLPVFGLYADFQNSVDLDVVFRSGRSRLAVTVPTPPFDHPASGVYLDPSVVQPRSRARLGYDYIMLKGYVGWLSPVIIDTDAEVRWVGTTGEASLPAILYENGIYVGSGAALVRMELDGTVRELANYASLGVTEFHHNFDRGKRGILAEVNTVDAIESVVIEVDGAGQLLKTWDLNEIVRDAMLAGGDDPSGFVKEGVDWFHNNACAYQKSEDALVLSSRESFVIALDYESGAIRWILGDPTKSWYQYPSLRAFALTLAGDSTPPVGQHAVSTKGGKLLLFDNGAQSANHVPPGVDRFHSAARRYRIDPKRKVAREIWTYPADTSVYSPYCSSVYEDRRRSSLVTYSLAGPFLTTDVVGLTSREEVAFHYSYAIPQGLFCDIAWNAAPVHLERLVFD